MSSMAFIVDATNYVCTHFLGTGGLSYPSAKALVDLVDAFTHRHQPSSVHVVFDGGGQTFRHELFADYKAGRTPKPDGLIEQLRLAHDLCDNRSLRIPGVEADDVIATLTHQHQGRTVILSRDKDLRQLLADGSVTILKEAHRREGQWYFTYFTAADLFRETGLRPEQWADFQALAGESDGWPGAEGIGNVTATKLLKAFGDLEGVIEAAKDWPSSLALSRAKIKLRRDQAKGLQKLDVDLARKMTTLCATIEIPAREPVELAPLPF